MVTVNQDRLIELFLELVRIDAVSRCERPVNDCLIAKVRDFGFAFHEDKAGEKVGGNAGNLIVTVPGQGDTVLFLGSHTDTVRPTGELKPQLRDGLITSSGDTILGADNRAGVAALLYLLEAAAHKQFSHTGFQAIFTICEEIGLLGAQHLDWSRVQAPHGYIIDSSMPPGNYVVKSPTAAEFKLDLHGKAAHAGLAPEKGVNAISMAAEILPLFATGRVDEHTVANIGIIRGGDATNVVPAHLHLEGEIRSFRHETIDQRLASWQDGIEAVCGRYGGTFTFHAEAHFTGYEIPSDHWLRRHLHERMQRIGLAPAPRPSQGGSDANVYNAAGKTAINLGMGAQNPHGNDERIAIADLVKTAELVCALVQSD